LPLDSPTSALTFGAGATAGYTLSRLVLLQAGGSWYRQQLPASALLPAFSSDQWTAFIGMTLTPPPLTF
jgi:hypothetical protein